MLDQFRWALLAPGDKVLVAVSGGPDSLCLLHQLWTEQAARRISVEAAHLDHGLRGEESAAEARWILNWCAEREIICHLGREDVAAFALAHKQSTQEAARAVRYAFLERTAASIGANKIATGHTRSDQVETVLGNILRGTGLDGLRGIPAQRGQIVRPMLDVSRAEVEAYCAAHDLTPRQDASNYSPDHYTRNRLRLELLPQLRREYNPRVDDALVRLSEIAGRDSDYLAQQAETALTAVTRFRQNDRIVLKRGALAALHPALLRYVVRLAATSLRGTGKGISYEHLETVCQAILTRPGLTYITWPVPPFFALTFSSPPCHVLVDERYVYFTMTNAAVSYGDVSASLPVPGRVALPELGWAITASWTETPGAARLDADAVDLGSFVARNWRFGDKIDPIGMSGRHKKVSDIFIDAIVPRHDRNRVPIVADAQGLVWVAGYTLAERVKVTEKAVRVLYLSVQKTHAGEKAGNGEGNLE